MNKEKELVDILYTVYCSDISDGGNEFHEMAKAIIAKYPQILAKRVWSGEARSISKGSLLKLIEHISPEKTQIEVFISEVK